MLSLPDAYHRAARAWPLDELADAYRAAMARGRQADPSEEGAHPIVPLSNTIPRLVRLAAAVHVLHVLPRRVGNRAADQLTIVDQLFFTLDQTAAGALHLCHLALESSERDDPVDEWVSHALEQAADALPHVSFTARPPSLIEHAEEAARWVAVAIDQTHSDPAAVPRAIADALAHLLVVCVLADLAYDRRDGRSG